MKHDEANLQVAICQMLQSRLLYFFCVPNDLLGQSKNAALRIARYKAIGLRSGISDLVIVTQDGKAHFMEIKTPKGTLSESQKNFADMCRACGWNYGVARSVEDASSLIAQWGIV